MRLLPFVDRIPFPDRKTIMSVLRSCMCVSCSTETFGIWFTVFISISSIGRVLCECPAAWTSAVELCIQEHAADYDSGDSYQQWIDSCRSYNESLSCLEGRIRACEGSGGDVSGVATVRDRMAEDMMVLCASNQTYWSYQEHSVCMNNLEASTNRCLAQYYTDSVAAYENNDKIYEYAEDQGDEYRDEIKEHICRAFTSLLRCINNIVMAACGEAAADLYNDVILTQVPSHVTDTCAEHLTSGAVLYIPFVSLTMLLALMATNIQKYWCL